MGGTRPWSGLSVETITMGVEGSLEAPPLARSIGARWPGWGLGEGHGGPFLKRDQTADVCWHGKAQRLIRAMAGGDATGNAQRVPLAKICVAWAKPRTTKWYYHAHLADRLKPKAPSSRPTLKKNSSG